MKRSECKFSNVFHAFGQMPNFQEFKLLQSFTEFILTSPVKIMPFETYHLLRKL